MTLTLNQGSFPHRRYPASQVLRASPSPHAAQPVPRGRLVEGTPPHRMGFPCCVKISVYRHAVVITPVARWALIARGTAYSNRFPVPSGCGLPHPIARSASTLVVSRPAQRSLVVTACRLTASPKATHLSRRLRRFCFLHHRSDSYRLERPRCRARISLAEDQHLQHGAQSGLTPRTRT